MAEPTASPKPTLPGEATLRVDVQTDKQQRTVPEEEAPDLDVPLHPGMKPLPDYELVSLLGRGGYGEVWKAHGPGGFDVALKFIRFGTAVPVEQRALELMRSIKHPNLLPIFGAWRKDKFLIIAMELGAGTLMQRLQECKNQTGGGIPLSELGEYLIDSAKAIDYLNERGIQHRDVKPQNLLMVGGGVKVADFGLAKFLEQSMASNSGALTPAYAAPEFFNGRTTQQSDQYSLAISYCQMRGAKLPFYGNPAQLMAGHLMQPPDLSMLPPAERPAVARALAKKPEERWPNCKTFMDEVIQAGQSKVIRAPEVIVPPVLPSASAPAETMRVKCPQANCGKVLRVKPEKWNKRLRCPNCQATFLAQEAIIVSTGEMAAFKLSPPPMLQPTPPALPPPLMAHGPLDEIESLPGEPMPVKDRKSSPSPPPMPHQRRAGGLNQASASAEVTDLPVTRPSATTRRSLTAMRVTARPWSLWVWITLALFVCASAVLGILIWKEMVPFNLQQSLDSLFGM